MCNYISVPLMKSAFKFFYINSFNKELYEFLLSEGILSVYKKCSTKEIKKISKRKKLSLSKVFNSKKLHILPNYRISESFNLFMNSFYRFLVNVIFQVHFKHFCYIVNRTSFICYAFLSYQTIKIYRMTSYKIS